MRGIWYWGGLLPVLAAGPLAADAPEPAGPDTVVVCPSALREALQPWVDWRQTQGHRLAFVAPDARPSRIRTAIRAASQGGDVRSIVLVGDAPRQTLGDDSPAPEAATVPTHYQPARIIARFGPDRQVATDNAYADLDDDGMPDLAIGRLTADTPADLAGMVAKIINFEKSPAPGSARQRIQILAGTGGFGALADGAIELTTRKFLTENIPAAYSTTVTYGSWRSPFCPDPRRFHETALDRLNEGSLFWVYVGHGQPFALDRVQVPGGAFHILDVHDMSKLDCQTGQPIAVFLACYIGAFDAGRDCLAEEMLRAKGGPVAVVCGSRMTMPYAMAVMGGSLMHEFFYERRATVGELMLHAKRQMLRENWDDADPRGRQRELLDRLAGVLVPGGDAESLRAERREHAALFHLLGDPLLRLPHPAPLELATPTASVAGATVPVVIRSPVAGACRLELACRRDQAKHRPASRSAYNPADESLAEYQQAYQLANDLSWHATQVRVQGAETRVALAIPLGARGPCVVRAYVEGEEREALGATELYVHPPTSP